MRFTTHKEQRDFYQKQGWIEFEDLLKEDQIKTIHHLLEDVLAERLKIPSSQVKDQPAERLYRQGHDLWRSQAVLQQFVMQPRFGEIAIELIGRKILRLGYDQLLPALDFPSSSLSSPPSSLPFYAPFMEQGLSLESMSSIKGLTCGVMIALGGTKGEILQQRERAPGEKIDIFPFHSGHVLFFAPHLPIAWECLAHHVGQRFYLIVYTSSLSFYQLQPNDPHTQALKHLGYIFNHPLVDKLNPIVYRP